MAQVSAIRTPAPRGVKIGGTAKVRWAIKTTVDQIVANGLPLVALLVLWELIAHSGFVHPALFPPLEKIFATTVDLARQGILLSDVAASLYRLLVSVVIGSVLGTGVGLSMGTTRLVERGLSPLLSFGLSIPGIAVIPLAILWFGLSERTIVSILALEVALVVILNTWTAIKSVDQRLIDAARTMGAQHARLFLLVLLPAALGGIIGGYRLGFSRAWRILVAGETLAGVSSGLGYRVFEAQQLLASDVVYASILVIGLLGLTLDRVLLRSLESFTVERWGAVRQL